LSGFVSDTVLRGGQFLTTSRYALAERLDFTAFRRQCAWHVNCFLLYQQWGTLKYSKVKSTFFNGERMIMGTKTRALGLLQTGAKWIGTKLLVLVLALGGVAVGFWFGGLYASPEAGAPSEQVAKEAAPQVWTCSMHPEIQLPKPGSCPKCGMDLIPLVADDGGGGARTFTTSEAARELMKIQTVEVTRRFVEKEVRMVGKVDFDETRLAYITSWVPGRLDRLYVDYTGIEVREGDHMVYLYSPELLTAQDELRRAAVAVSTMRDNAPEVLKKTIQSTLRATREKLRRWGLTDSQIKAAERSESPSDHITIYAPAGGTVIHKNGQEGMYVKTGTRIYTIADLSSVWVKLDAYESHLAWIHYGQTISFTTESYPGEVFEGTIAFIDPVLEKKTRTVKVRVNVPNPDRKLKPEMFVRALVRSQVATGGRVMDADLAGKWICPMHPEVVKERAEKCDVCGMNTVKAEELGYIALEQEEEIKPLVIPASAALVTGTRAVVYVEIPNSEKPTFEGREIVLGSRAGDFYIVESGLDAGERVVTNGNFKIDSALQLQAKPSMMTPVEETVEEGSGTKVEEPIQKTFSAPEAFQAQLGHFYAAYLELQEALASDALEEAQKAVATGLAALTAVDMKLLGGEAHMEWMGKERTIKNALESMKKAVDIESVRKELYPLSDALWPAIQAFGIKSDTPVYRAHCPMALEDGAHWLQANEEVRNPYYGASMLGCGSIVAGPEKSDEAPEGSETKNMDAEGSDHK
jgi:membrane fusion protein, copper/silver efflux system